MNDEAAGGTSASGERSKSRLKSDGDPLQYVAQEGGPSMSAVHD